MYLRAHHLLCGVLFEGKGYSQGFVENMTRVVNQMKTTEGMILVTTTDSICNSCPNKIKEKGCSLDKNEVVGKDEQLLQALQLEENVVYDAKILFRLIETHLTKEIFEHSCKYCRWYGEELCSYEKYKKKLLQFR